MLINGSTELIAHIGFPTHSFKAPMIYNPYFESVGVNALVVPMGCQPDNFAKFLPSVFGLSNIRGALITMPHKVAVTDFLDKASAAVNISGACNAVKKSADGKLIGDMFDGEGFVRGIIRKGFSVKGKSALVIGSGGVGSAIAASLAKAGIAQIALFDVNADNAIELGKRLQKHYPKLQVTLGSNDPTGFSLLVNATPLGMNEGDALPVDVSKLAASTFVGEVVMKTEMTAFLSAAKARGCQVQIGTDMLFEMIPAYLEFFGFPTTTPDVLQRLARVQY